MLPSSYWEALEPKNLKMLSVEEATSVLITKTNLEVNKSFLITILLLNKYSKIHNVQPYRNDFVLSDTYCYRVEYNI